MSQSRESHKHNTQPQNLTPHHQELDPTPRTSEDTSEIHSDLECLARRTYPRASCCPTPSAGRTSEHGMTTTSGPAHHGDKYKGSARTERDGIPLVALRRPLTSLRPGTGSGAVVEKTTDDSSRFVRTRIVDPLHRSNFISVDVERRGPRSWASSPCLHGSADRQRSCDP